MLHQKVLVCFCVTLLCMVIAAPALAATVECPSTCSCLLPAKAKELGYSGYCEGKQVICNYDTAKNPMYCYQKPTTIPEFKPIVTTVKPTVTVTPTPVVPSQCPSGCTCFREKDAITKGLVYCGGKQTLCGYDNYQNPLYCFGQPTETTMTPIPTTTNLNQSKVSPTPTLKVPVSPTTTVTLQSKATPAPTEGIRPIITAAIERTPAIPDAVPCRANFSCLDEGTIRAKDYTIDSSQPDTCGYSKTKGLLYCAQTSDGKEPVESQESGIVETVFNFFGSLFGAPSESALSSQSTAYLDYCETRYGLDSCNSYCANLSTDVDNCGGCGDWCLDHQQCYNGRCIDIRSDPENCGGFGNVCPEGAPCVEGYCSALGCMDPLRTACNNSCVQTAYDEQNCGSCGYRCAENEGCISGVCEPCATGKIFCDEGGCADIMTDDRNCGACQHECTSGTVCTAGVCSGCRAGMSYCDGRCVDVMTDESFCGSCDTSCAIGQTCSSGTCFECPEGGSLCGGRCVDLQNNFENCGSCGHVCQPFFFFPQLCDSGQCFPHW